MKKKHINFAAEEVVVINWWKKLLLGKRKYYLGIGVIVLAIVLIFVFKGKPKVQYNYTDLKRINLIQTVSEVGTVKAAKELELNFLQSGALRKVNVKIGEQVLAGQVLAELDMGQLESREKEALSALEAAQANLRKLIVGASKSDIAVSEAQVAQARAAYNSAVSTVAENINQANKRLNDLETIGTLTTPRQAVNSAQVALDNFKSSGLQTIRSSRAALITTVDSKLATGNAALDYMEKLFTDYDLRNAYGARNITIANSSKDLKAAAVVLGDLAKNKIAIARTSNIDTDLNAAVLATDIYLDKVYVALGATFNSLENTVTSASLSQTTLDTYKATISNHQIAMSAGISALQVADYNYQNANLNYSNGLKSADDALNQAIAGLNDAITAARNTLSSATIGGNNSVSASLEALNLAEKQLAKIKASARQEDLAVVNAQVRQAQASLDLIFQQKSDNSIIAPISGQVSKINYEIGEQVIPGKAAISMITENNLEVAVDISESEISKLKNQDQVEITLDALSDQRKFQGTVYFIEPSATIIRDVTYYNVKIKFIDAAELLTEIKSGMTANVNIETNRKDNVLAVPARAIIDKNVSGKFVRVLNSDLSNYQEVLVETGLSGNDGLIEVIAANLKAGDKIVLSVKTN